MRNLIIFGSPGAGKGTQAELVAKKYRLKHLSCGEIMRRERGRGVLGKKIQIYYDRGQLVPDSLTIVLMEKQITKALERGLILDGYPRNLRQAKALDKLLKTKKTAISLVLNLQLSEAEALKRILLRAKTSGRSDDNLKTIHNRFRVYHAQTAPLLKYYSAQKKIINIDGRPPIVTIFKDIAKKLK